MNRSTHQGGALNAGWSLMMDLAVSISNSDAARLYWVDPAAYELRLVNASSTLEDGRIAFIPGGGQWLESLRRAEVLTSADAQFASFPKAARWQIASLLVCPLRVEERMAGVLTLARENSRPFAIDEIDNAGKLGDALSAMMKAEVLHEKLRVARRENALLEKRLAERKLLERAKGLLQVQCGWTEEDAYYHIRRTSRQQRTPMAVIAQRIIDVTASKELHRERMSA